MIAQNERDALVPAVPGAEVSGDVGMVEILQRIPHRPPFLFVDRARDYQAFRSIVGVKCVTMSEPFFAGHFPGNPVMPGVLIVEAMAQTGALLMSKSLNADLERGVILFMSIDGVRFRHPVRPGDVLMMSVEVTRHRGRVFKFHGDAHVDGMLVAQTDFAAVVADNP